jgi:lipopolysaccharide heptosyltransferase I
MNDLRQRQFERILLIKPSSPGDIIHALPVLHGLRRRYSTAHIAWLVARPFADLVSADPDLSEVIAFDRQHFGRMGRSLAATLDFFSFVGQLRKRQFDLVIDLQGLFRSGFFARATAAVVRIGFGNARELAWAFYTHRIPIDDMDTHAADRNYLVAGVLGFDERPLDFNLTIPPHDRTVAAGLLAEAGFGPQDALAVLVPATRWETKCWPAERFGQVASRLYDAAGIRSVLVGGSSDRPAGDAAAAASDGAAVSLCGRTTLRQLAALIDRAAIVITADSTPMHLAAALDRPLVALFGPTNPVRTGPYARMHDVVRLQLACSPCYLRRIADCPFDHACMRQLAVEPIVDAALARLRVSAPSRPLV